MANYCIVAPPQVLHSLARFGHIGTHHLVLAHDIVRPEKQRDYFDIFNPNGTFNFYYDQVILDNGVAETMKAADLSMVVDAVAIVSPTCVVLPDAYLDTDKTIADCKVALDPWTAKFMSNRNIQFMYLPQGKDPKDFMRAATAEPMMSDPRIQWWGIPRNIVAHHGTRRWAIELCHALNKTRQIHLFGFSDELYDDIVCSQHPLVTSIDSAVPVRQATKFPDCGFIGPRGFWWEKGTLTPLNVENITAARRILSR